MQPLTVQFKHYLTKQKLSPATLKNYVSDVDRFLGWLSRQLQETTIQPLQLTARVFEDYAAWLNDPINRINPVSAQRYLASLKRFGSFLFNAKLNDINPAEA
ncbi:MAG: site-specific integrase [Patescibacteria group bacterium]|nr:site-specific integrase [Patescibacteria group bacterium]